MRGAMEFAACGSGVRLIPELLGERLLFRDRAAARVGMAAVGRIAAAHGKEALGTGLDLDHRPVQRWHPNQIV
jgi:hypothetical protein